MIDATNSVTMVNMHPLLRLVPHVEPLGCGSIQVPLGSLCPPQTVKIFLWYTESILRESKAHIKGAPSHCVQAGTSPLQWLVLPFWHAPQWVDNSVTALAFMHTVYMRHGVGCRIPPTLPPVSSSGPWELLSRGSASAATPREDCGTMMGGAQVPLGLLSPTSPSAHDVSA